MIRLTLLLFLSLIVSFSMAQNKSHNIFVDGGYGKKTKDQPVNKMLEERLDEAQKEVERLTDNEDVSKRINTRADLEQHLKSIECKCGDEINLYMVGHGTKGKFVFSEASKHKDKYVTADSLRSWLGKAAVECCCKINVVIFSCYSGSMIIPLLEEEHIKSVYTSTGATEKTYSDAHYEGGKFVDNGDWMKGFVEDLKLIRSGPNMTSSNGIASVSAHEKMPTAFAHKEHPRDG